MANRLASATSPYLLQHAGNPVDWWGWGEEAFEVARRRNVPVLLSVGYAACHWCHVMAHESFEDEATAARINADFVPVKVDREERPDVDAVYMAATQALTGQGGWPMTVFLTPDGRPFYAGTYFPPAPMRGMPSFTQVLEAIAGAWRERREEVLRSAGTIAAELMQRQPPSLPGQVGLAELDAARKTLGEDFDAAHGGFGGAPKFPPSMVLEALLRDGSDESQTMVATTTEAMARGGLYDQLAGGFARYSVDAEWAVPHFEKMLYDNALLLGVYTHRWRRSGDRLAHRVVSETIEWLLQEMRTSEGAFAASLDADSLDATGHLHEGAFYVWTPAELVDVLGGQDGQWAAEVFGVSPSGTFEHGASTLQRPRRDELEDDRLARVRDRLRAAREQRPRPGRDDKVVAAWNGWLVDALLIAGMTLKRPAWVAAAREALEVVWSTHWHPPGPTGRLRRVSRDGVAGDAPGILEDYGAVAQASARLAQVSGDPVWLDRARTLLRVVEQQFADGAGGWFDSAADAESLYARPRDVTDNATPSGLSATVHALRLTAALTGETWFRERADSAAATVGGLVGRAPRFAGWMWADAITSTRDEAAPVQVVVVGPPGSDRDALVTTAWREAPAGSVVLAGEPGDDPDFALLADRPALRGQPTAYMCRDFVCRLPVTDVGALEAQLRS